MNNEVRPSLLQHLSRQSWSELRLARLLLKQFREDSYEAEIWEAIASGDASMYIVQEPITIRYHQLVQFRIYFRRPELNWSGARQLVSPEWEFSDGSRPRGWTISHFFDAPPKRSWKWLRLKKSSGADEPVTTTEHVTVNFDGLSNANGGQLERKTGALRLALPLHRDSYDDGKSGTFSELVALAVSIFIPLVSLMTTAREQLAQNPFGGALMIFLLGFSSDALISVFKQRTTPSS